MAGLSVLIDRTGCSFEPEWDLRIGSNVFTQLERALPPMGCLFISLFHYLSLCETSFSYVYEMRAVAHSRRASSYPHGREHLPSKQVHSRM